MEYLVTLVTSKLTVQLLSDGQFYHETYGTFTYLRHLFEKIDAIDVMWHCRIYCNGQAILDDDGTVINDYHEIRSKFSLCSYVERSRKVYEYVTEKHEAAMQKRMHTMNESIKEKIYIENIVTKFKRLNTTAQKKCIKRLKTVHMYGEDE